MKKNVLILAFLFTCGMLFSAEINETKTTFPEYQGVVTTSINASELYSQAKLWVAETFKSSSDVIDYDSSETNTLIVKGVTRYDVGKVSEARILFTLKIEGKENRFRYTLIITDITAASPGPNGYQSGYHLYAKDPQGKYVSKFSEEFRKTIRAWMNDILNTTVNGNDSEDW